jgi:YfiH family protein
VQVQSKLLNKYLSISHSFGTIKSPRPESCELPLFKQVHGDKVLQVKAKGQVLTEADGVWTKAPGVPIGIRTADCVPAIVIEKNGKYVSVIHAGWRGVLNQILIKELNLLIQKGISPDHLAVALGPSIQECCYAVGSDLVTKFSSTFSEIPGKIINPNFKNLSLKNILAFQISQLKINSLEIINACTFCAQNDSVPLYHSHRRDSDGLRQWSTVEINR